LARSAYDNAWDLDAEQAVAVREALLSLVGAGWGGAVVELAIGASGGDEPAIIRQVKAYIVQHLDNPTLSPPAIARAQGVSVRHLHRLFKAGGVSLGDWVRQRRLAQCAADLADVANDGRSLTEIAFRWGFSDSAHFSRSFRAQYGVAPRDYRAGRKLVPNFLPPEGLACS
jgi:AraC-like DNA-binding protein